MRSRGGQCTVSSAFSPPSIRMLRVGVVLAALLVAAHGNPLLYSYMPAGSVSRPAPVTEDTDETPVLGTGNAQDDVSETIKEIFGTPSSPNKGSIAVSSEEEAAQDGSSETSEVNQENHDGKQDHKGVSSVHHHDQDNHHFDQHDNQGQHSESEHDESEHHVPAEHPNKVGHDQKHHVSEHQPDLHFPEVPNGGHEEEHHAPEYPSGGHNEEHHVPEHLPSHHVPEHPSGGHDEEHHVPEHLPSHHVPEYPSGGHDEEHHLPEHLPSHHFPQYPNRGHGEGHGHHYPSHLVPEHPFPFPFPHEKPLFPPQVPEKSFQDHEPGYPFHPLGRPPLFPHVPRPHFPVPVKAGPDCDHDGPSSGAWEREHRHPIVHPAAGFP